MTPKLKISTFVLKRIEKVKQQSSGCLFGLMYDGTLLIMGFNIESTIGELNYKQIQYMFPAELDLCGVIKFGDPEAAEVNVDQICQDVDFTDNPILLTCVVGTLVDLKAQIIMHGKLEDIPYEEVTEEELYREFCFTRLQCGLRFMTEANNVDVMCKDMQTLRKNLACGSLAFHFEDLDRYITSSGLNGKQSSDTVSDLLVNSNNPDSDKKQKAKNKATPAPTEYEIINVKALTRKTRDLQEKSSGAMKMTLKHNDEKVIIPIEVDSTAMLYKKTNLGGLYDILIESICRSLRLVEKNLVDLVTNSKNLSPPRIIHINVPGFGHFLSSVYFDSISEDDPYLQQKRKKLHHHFGLPITSPQFRKANRYVFRDELKNAPLVNPHIGLKPTGLKESQQYLVQGRYSYYHYKQQNYDDSGWGCAYRSLQTLCSWFRWQGFTDSPIPTHEEIQRYLVKVGDKPRDFIGSNKWIGSIEVQTCLKGFMNVDSRILNVQSGRDLATKGSELAMHFQSQGTPIMIGGGVLAHTILGVDFNSMSGDIRFLILDPHYTDIDDLSIIQGKGWCGWKGPEFWDKKAYYNLCMPQRPYFY